MKKTRATEAAFEDNDTMRPEYDFSGAVRGVAAARYAEGTNVVLVSADVRDVFPNAATVNEALRAPAPLLRGLRGKKGHPTGHSSRSRPVRRSGEPDPSSAVGHGD